jgi:hypothetical protein
MVGTEDEKLMEVTFIPFPHSTRSQRRERRRKPDQVATRRKALTVGLNVLGEIDASP